MTKQNAVGAAVAIAGIFLYSLAKHQAAVTAAPLHVSFHSTRNKFKSQRLALLLTVLFLSGSNLMLTPGIAPVLNSNESDKGLLQPMLHVIRINNVQVQEMVHIFNRVDELQNSHTNIVAKVSGAVLCFTGASAQTAATLSEVWVDKLKGKVGVVSPTPLAPHGDFIDCDAIVASGGTYRATASWAFQSSVPVINVWNSDGYYLQAAMLFVHKQFSKQKLPNELHLVNAAALVENIWLSIGMWADETAAFQELGLLFGMGVNLCRPNSSHCRDKAAKVTKITGPILTSPSPALMAALAEFVLAKSGKLRNSYPFPGIRCKGGVIVAGKVNEHDPNFAYSDSGSILFDLQWERVTKAKYSIVPGKGVAGLEKAGVISKNYAAKRFGVSKIDLAVVVRSLTCFEMGSTENRTHCKGERQLSEWLPNVPIVYHEHLLAHTLHAFFDSPFDTAVVIAAHGGGASEPFNCAVYLAKRGVQPILLKLCESRRYLGDQYTLVGGHFSEVVSYNDFKNRGQLLSWAGVFMGYSALGKPLPCLQRVKDIFFPSGAPILELIQKECSAFWNPTGTDNATAVKDFPRNLPVETQRDIARTFEEVWEYSFVHLLDNVQEELALVDGIALAGGCALNVKSAQRVWNYWNKPVHVPSAPSDDGIGVGGAWGICQPPRNILPLQYHGLPLLDKHDLGSHISAWGTACENLGLGEEAATRVAKLLAVEKKIVAVVIGNQEFGPRALSHRSLMAYPDSIAIRERMNELKFRKFYRPTCPTMTEEFVNQTFVRPENVRSPFMSFAPELQDWVEKELPAVKHFDNTARPQTLSASKEPFVHSMLQAIPKVLKTGKPIVINTSFNIKGQPIINTAEDSLFMLCDRPQLDYLFMEGYLFSLPGNSSHPACAAHRERLNKETWTPAAVVG